MIFKGKIATLSSIIGINFILLSAANGVSTKFSEAILNAYRKYTHLSVEDIKNLSEIVDDWVKHFEMAVTLGTSFTYADEAKASIFNAILEKENQCSRDINLNTCAKELVCDDKVFTNFWPTFKNIHCKK